MSIAPMTASSPRSPRAATALFRAGAFAALALAAMPARAQVAGAITIYPATSTVEAGSTKQFTAYVPISPNTIRWLVNGIVGGNATVGTITAAGLYTPPATIPAQNIVTVKAQSVPYPTSAGSTTLTITRKVPSLWSVSPSPMTKGAYKVTFNGANFTADAKALANGTAVTTKYVSSTKIEATGTTTVLGTVQFAVSLPGPGAVTGNSVAVQVVDAPIAVTVSPSSATTTLGGSQTFAATVTGTANTAVTWAVNGTTGGTAATGAISTAGVYTAPASMPSPSTVTIRATSAANSASYAQANVTLVAPVSVSVSPGSATVSLGGKQSFAATVTGNANTSVNWSVNGTNGGSSAVGTISSAGLYTAPSSMPSPSTVTIRATSVVSASATATATVTLVPPVTVVVAPSSASVVVQNTQLFTATVTGTANTAVTWSVNGTVGGSAAVGTISSGGLYAAPSAVPTSSTVTIRATSVASPTSFSQATVTLSSQPPPATSLSAARFLEQSSFGPTPATLARVQQLGIPAYLDEQLNLPETPIFAPSNGSMGDLRQWLLYNYTTAPDQLRQRVAYALSQIIVTSANKLIYSDEILPWMHLLSQNAFGNYRDLLHDVTISGSMGKYLDLANSMKTAASGANENYPREMMQLFTIGLWTLNPDGSLALDSRGAPIPTYTQQTVQQVALALTGWTYATAPGATPQSANWEYFGAPMEPRPARHDGSAKSFLGCSLPSGGSPASDLDGVIDCLMQQPNIAPFIATRLIRSLVTSNPTPGYIQRVASVFANNGLGVRGDLRAVVKAILLDPEARQDTAPPTSGRLKEPILQVAGLLRSLNGGFSSGQQLTYLFDYMGQSVLTPPSVFSWFSPLYRVPNHPLFGPEFQIFSPTEATLRGNLFYMLLHSPMSDVAIDLSPFQQYGNDVPTLVEAVNQVLLYGRMPAGMRTALINAATPGYDAATRIETVLYLTALSGQYAVQY